jgi:hypothetical protein
MMLKLTEIRQWIASLGIAEDQHVYIGKLDNKQQKSIGVYGRSGSGSPGIALEAWSVPPMTQNGFLFWCIGLQGKLKAKWQRMNYLKN